MYRPHILLLLLAAAPLSPIYSQEPASGEVAAEAIGQLREIVCAEAASFESPIQHHAVQVVRKNGYVDARFDDLIRSALNVDDGATQSEEFRQRLSIALQLMPHSKLDDSEKVRLTIDALMVANDQYTTDANRHLNAIPLRDYNSNAVPIRELIKLLERHPKELARQLEPMLAEDPKPIICALAHHTNEHGVELLPHLLAAVRSNDRAMKLAGLAATMHILGTRPNEVGIQADPKIVTYAERIIARYDRNGDKELTANEWSSMLMSPEAADSSGDGTVTVEEYARWMESRRKKR